MLINSHNSDFSEKMQKCQDYIQGLEDERSKIQVFQRELPLCLELVTQAIEACKQQLSGTTSEYNLNSQSECSDEETCSHEKPILEDFMHIKRASSHSDHDHDDDDDEHESKRPKNDTNLCNKDVKINSNDHKKKSDWLRSVQLWNQTPDPPSNQGSPKKVEVKKNGNDGAFHPFKKEKIVATTAPTPPPENRSVPLATTSSTAESGGGSGGNKKADKEEQSERKARRCWSPELHRRFLQALQQLGGAHVATPKQIRELMKVDGLTNDEVKSHLQKYRLHTRRPSQPNPNNNNSNTQTPQFVVVGGIWMPPEYSTMAATTATSGEASGVAATSNRIYAPIAKLPPPFKESTKQRQHSNNHSEGEDQSHSPAASSSTRTTTASQRL